MRCLWLWAWIAKHFGERIEWNGPNIFGVGYRLGRTIYFEKIKKH